MAGRVLEKEQHIRSRTLNLDKMVSVAFSAHLMWGLHIQHVQICSVRA
jgi:hypothetical protein